MMIMMMQVPITNDEDLNIALTELKLEPMYRLSLHFKHWTADPADEEC